MDIILSHEQGDFDSLGSLFGMYLLNRNAFPVLQHRQNRNVHAFLDLYHQELTFRSQADLPDEPVENLTLVDTQSMPTIKGVNKSTVIHVLDHHPKRADLPESWDMVIERTGACTTLIVEKLMKQPLDLTPIQSTLLILGIYEDTGSMTYESTTSRDLQAAAYLLEKGANLRIANKYLNPPLSVDQQTLFDALLSSSETFHIHGLNILVACADAGKMTDEVSTLAHKMRELLDPDALFILARTLEGIRLVARSTSDQVNVAAVAAHFGGGGHSRAASALIHPKTGGDKNTAALDIYEIKEALLQTLKQMINPAVTVGQIMSHRPLLISPQTTAEEALRLMKRYGYEGYPVVEGGMVLGLLTRRAVDRALDHKLNLPAASLMYAGEVTVRSDESMESLQKIMMASGWGQVPVLDPGSQKIIGIITRTDLFRHLSNGKSLVPTSMSIIDGLKEALPQSRMALLKVISELAFSRCQAIYIVGGFVRDLLLHRPSLDFDLVVEGNAIDLAKTLEERFGGSVVSHKRFGTAKWSIAAIRPGLARAIQVSEVLDPQDLPENLDFISARTEFYDYPTALPTIEHGNIKLDLRRRDFSINTLALRLDGEHYGKLYDFWGGYNDLQQGVIRVLHALSFIDDPTRMLRAVRFEQRFNFLIDLHTLQLMEEALPLLGKVSGQRLRHELDLMLNEENIVAMFKRMDQLHLLLNIHPALSWGELETEAVRNMLERPAPVWEMADHYAGMPFRVAGIYLIWISVLPLKIIEDISKRLRFSRKLENALYDCCKLRQDLVSLKTSKPSEITRRLRGVPLIVLYALGFMDLDLDAKNLLGRFILEWSHKRPLIDGKGLQQMGIEPGPIYQQFLDRLQDAWLDGEIQSFEEERLLLEKMISQIKEA